MELETILGVAALVLGAIVGSFLNALSFRIGTGRSVATGRSRCMRCGHTLGALDLVPVLSYLFLRGRCRYCEVRISPQYPLVEVAAALLSLGVYLANLGPLMFAFWFVVWMILLFVVVYDWRHKIIPAWCSATLFALALLRLLVIPFDWWVAAGVLLGVPLLLLSFVSGGRWMGWGDGLLELSLGFLLGFFAGLTALVLAFWVGAAVGICLMLLKKRVTLTSEIPFAPFLIVGVALVYFFHVDLFSTLSSFL